MAKSEDRIDEIEARLKKVEAFVGISHGDIEPDVNVGSVATPATQPEPVNISNFLGVSDAKSDDAAKSGKS